MKTIKQISAIVGRAPTTVNSQVFKMGLVPEIVEPINKRCNRYWYNQNDVAKILGFYESLDNPEVVVQRKQKKMIFPEFIYVTRETEIIHSKLNFLKLSEL